MIHSVVTKFDIGDTFWVPRVFPKGCMDIQIINGKEYVHEYTELTIKVKPKKIHAIKIEFTLVDNEVSPEIIYIILDTDRFLTCYSEHKTLMFATEKEAYDYAEQHKRLVGTELYH